MLCFVCIACGKSELWEEHSVFVADGSIWKPVSGSRSDMQPHEFLSALDVSEARVKQLLCMSSEGNRCDDWRHITFEYRFPVPA